MSKKTESTDAGPVRSSKEPAASPLTTVSGLMAERRRFESWLAGLEARRDTTPARVFARVHADYTSRLEAVVGQLTSHTQGLRDELGSLATRLAAIHDEQQQVRDERAEAELRAHVGELTPAEWESTARAADERIDRLSSRHAELETELQRTRELLTDAERPATPHLASAAVPARPRDASVEATVSASVNAAMAEATPGSLAAVGDSAEGEVHVPAAKEPAAPAPRPAERRVAPAEEVEVPTEVTPSVIAAEAKLLEESPAAPGPNDTAKPAARNSSFDELAFLSSVVDTPPKAPAKPAAEPPRRGAGDAVAPRAAAAPPLSAPPAAPPRPVASQPRERDSGIVNMDATADTSALGRPAKKGTPMAANISGNNPIILKDKPGEGAKTLKCADCGAMNYPTEWYCERCGAELASL